MKYFALIFTLLLHPISAVAEIVVITHPDSALEQLSRKEIIDLYMGRVKHLPSGEKASTFDLPMDSEHRKRFYKGLTGKTIPQINAYWARLIFSGRATPPQSVDSTKEVIDTVMSNSSAIGYIDKSELVGTVKVIANVEY